MTEVMTLGEFTDSGIFEPDPPLWIATFAEVFRVDSVAWDPDDLESLPRVLAFTEAGDPITLRLHLATPLFASADEARQKQDDDDRRRSRRRQGLRRW